jgi:hypothetical protein
MVGALLASACVADPAYIGEGAANEGGTSGAGGTNSSGGSGGTGASEPTTGGSSGGMVKPLPPSGTCTITRKGYPEPNVVTWNADTRVVDWVEGLHKRYNDQGLPAELSWDGSRARYFIGYDAQGTVTSFDVDDPEAMDVAETWQQTNTYDAQNRLESSHLVYSTGRTETDRVHYANGNLALVDRSVASDGEQGTFTYVIDHDRGRPIRWDTVALGDVIVRETATYDDAGRLVQVEVDQGAPPNYEELDGIAEFRQTWFYDDAGRLIRYENDFETPGLAEPVPDGVGDLVWSFAPDCADIAEVDRRYFHLLPNWLVPYSSTGGFRL